MKLHGAVGTLGVITIKVITAASTVTDYNVFYLLFAGDVPLEVLTQIVGTISDPSAMLGPEVCYKFQVFCGGF